MNRLTVLYDATCGFCRRCRWWLAAQPSFVPLEFLPVQSAETARWFPTLAVEHGMAEELVVVSDDGDYYRGAGAFIMCLWALRDYREWSEILAQPALIPLARTAFDLLSGNRKTISCWLGLDNAEDLEARLRHAEATDEDAGGCGAAGCRAAGNRRTGD